MEENRQFRDVETTNKGVSIISLFSGKNSPLIISLLLTSFCFILIGVVGWQTAFVLKPQILENPGKYNVFQTVGFVFILIPIIGSFFVYKRINTIKSIWLILMIVLYMIGEIIGFSLIFILHNVELDWILAFAFAGVMFFICGIVGFFCKWISKIWKYVAAVSMVWLLMMVLMIVFRFAFESSVLKDIHLIMAGILGVLTMFYIMLDVNRMKDFIADPNNTRRTINTILLTTFRFLIDLVNLVWVFARLTFLR